MGNCELTVLETQATLGTYDTGRRKKDKNKQKQTTKWASDVREGLTVCFL
jgi:hypothetical protein